MKEIPKAYNPQEVEDKIYKKWEESGFFQPKADQSRTDNPDSLELPKNKKDDKENRFVISMPPPNATGVLHLGHASMLAYQDLMVRYNRMRGKNTLWLPGTDHASIATQTKVEKIIAKEGKTKYDLGREKFLERVNDYVENSQSTIKNQTKKMGSSCDWSRERYTLDDGLSRAVREVFVKMYNDGLIYRGDRVVNWCPRCESTLADDEVEHKDQKANLYYFKYNKDFPITIATTRPETKLGDTAVAVNPKDERYKKYVGRIFEVDLGSGVHKIKVIADREVDMEFGTGALGVTPAHSMVDWEMAKKNDLEKIKIIGEDGRMNENAGKDYAGLTVIEAREKFVKYLEENGLIEKVEEIDQSLSICYRCGASIEPLPSLQWFVNVDKKITIENNKYFQNKSLKEVAKEVVNKEEEDIDEKIKILPGRFSKTYFNWMDNLHDWCISRQLWFGHQIPVWYKEANKKIDITYFVHGTTVDNENNKASGHYNIELSELGIQQSKELKNKIKNEKFDVVFCSDLKRAINSANLTFSDRNIKIIQDKRLRECDYGDLTQTDTSKVLKIEKSVINKTFPNGESYKDVEERILDFLSYILDNYQGKKIAIVAHKAPQLALDVILKNKNWEQAFDEDWRKKKKWKAGWKYELGEIRKVSKEDLSDKNWTQDPDTLDTWFSSGLWTFSTLLNQDHEKYKTFEEWIENSPDLKKFHPTSVMETGYDILFFWIARMILMTTYTLGEVPFENVYLHGMVRDKQGRKMSKSLGNGIDPIEMIEKYGTDALRLSMIVGSSPGNDLRLYEEKIEGYRNFVNKLWNISRYILMSVDDINIDTKNLEPKTLADKWILENLENLKYVVDNSLEKYQFSFAIDSDEGIRTFMWDKFADWYLEVSKVQGKNDAVLIYVLENLLKLCHPFIPFVTEQIWQEMGKDNLLMVEKWPKNQGGLESTQTSVSFDLLQEIISGIRTVKNENKVLLKEKVDVIINIEAGRLTKEEITMIEENQNIIEKLAGTKNLKIGSGLEKPEGWIQFDYLVSVYINVGDLIDKEKEIEKTKKEIEEKEKYIKQIKSKLGNDNFVANAPGEIIEKEREKYEESKEKLKKLEEKLKSFSC